MPFTHFAEATGSPDAYVGTGLPGGLLLNPVDGNLSGIPATAGIISQICVQFTLMVLRLCNHMKLKFW